MSAARTLIALLLLLAVMAGSWFGSRYFAPEPATAQLTGEGVEQLPDFSFPDLEGAQRSNSEWTGRVLVVNFWATWCPPCREEMPRFIEMQAQYGSQGLQFVGIAIDEPDMVRDFFDVYAINFPTLIGDDEAIKLANTLGNRFNSLPFTAVFDRQGKTRYFQAGEVTDETLAKEVLSLL
ncbi:MAG: TlpA family protein disulfide reductase [Gammaproteobacteria bacterium]|nr:TlpA family protein disulfide reductase [Gammaproteobacteria bacterium]